MRRTTITGKRFFAGLAVLMFICMLVIVSMEDSNTVPFGVVVFMSFVACGAWIGCTYLAGGFDDVIVNKHENQ